MFNVAREIHFSYGHRLLKHAGPCAHLHGHNARVLIEISSEKLNQMNMVIDFSEIRATIGTWIKETLDHKTLLWDQDPLLPLLQKAGEPIVVMQENPTAEALAHWIFEEARKKRLAVSKVTLWETENSYAAYHE